MKNGESPAKIAFSRGRGYSMSTTLAQWMSSSWFFGVWSHLILTQSFL